MHFGQIPRVPGDPILGLMDLYRADTNPAKLDLGVGVYKDAQGLTPIPRAVKLAEQRLVDSEQTKSYIGGHGDAQFGALLLRQVLGSRAIALGEQRAGCTQAPGGTGALRLAGEFIAKCLPGRSIWLSIWYCCMTRCWARFGPYKCGKCSYRLRSSGEKAWPLLLSNASPPQRAIGNCSSRRTIT